MVRVRLRLRLGLRLGVHLVLNGRHGAAPTPVEAWRVRVRVRGWG